ncbi:MAG: helix-hairpin-helix domain-containing protein [Bacteroidales bacterium]
MIPMKAGLVILVFLLSVNAVYPQEERIPDIIMEIAEQLSEEETESDAAGDYAVRLYDLAEKPVRVNTADESELSRLFFLTDFQVKALADYVSKTGKIYSVYEIAAVPGFNTQLAALVAPFVTLEEGKQEEKKRIRLRNDILMNFSVKFPPSDTSAPGGSWKMLTKYRFSAGPFSGSVTSEKDAGEKLFNGKKPVTDFLSANLVWEGKGFVRKVIAGDFGARYGMGTGINTSLRTGLSLTQPGYLSGGDEIRPYTSTDENIFFRGAAVQFLSGKTGMTLFWSRNRIDASLDTAGNQENVYISTLQRSGLHTTASSLAARDAVAETSYGLSISTDIRSLRLSLLWTQNRFSVPVMNDDPAPGELYDFTGSVSTTVTAGYKYMPGRVLLYGELSVNPTGRKAFVQGISFKPSDRLSMNLVYRDYDPGYVSFHGKGLFSSSSGDNCSGIFGNFTFEAARHLFLSAGVDVKINPWLRYRCSAPSYGISREIRLRYLPSDKMSFEAVYSYRQSMLDLPGSTGIKKQYKSETTSLRGSFRYMPLEKLMLTTRIDHKSVSPGGLAGISMLQDISWQLRAIPATVWFRHCIFRTGDWDSRIYAYENDLVHSFSIPALWGNGSRSCVMISVRPSGYADFRIKFAFGDSSGPDGRRNTSEMKVQARIRF